MDKFDSNFKFLSDDDLIQQMLNQNEVNDENEQVRKIVSHAETMISKCLNWF